MSKLKLLGVYYIYTNATTQLSNPVVFPQKKQAISVFVKGYIQIIVFFCLFEASYQQDFSIFACLGQVINYDVISVGYWHILSITGTLSIGKPLCSLLNVLSVNIVSVTLFGDHKKRMYKMLNPTVYPYFLQC